MKIITKFLAHNQLDSKIVLPILEIVHPVWTILELTGSGSMAKQKEKLWFKPIPIQMTIMAVRGGGKVRQFFHQKNWYGTS